MSTLQIDASLSFLSGDVHVMLRAADGTSRTLAIPAPLPPRFLSRPGLQGEGAWYEQDPADPVVYREADPPQPPTAEQRLAQLLAGSDSNLGASVVSAMSVDPRPENFEALGRILRAGIQACSQQEIENVMRRKARR